MTNPLDVNKLRERVALTLSEFISDHRKIISNIATDTEVLVDSLASLVTGGKRLRPAFAYWGYLAGGGEDGEAIIKACSALEFLQACALIHDDVMDNSDTRRGNPSVHKQFESLHLKNKWLQNATRFGDGAAILIGDLALSWADELIFTSGLSDEQIKRANAIYHLMRTELMAGQYLDLLEQVRGQITVERSEQVIKFKSAKYTIERPLLMGASIANASPEIMNALSKYGLALGEAFQLRDDMLGVFGKSDETGKPIGDDLREGKQTMLIARAREMANPEQIEILNNALGNENLSEIQVREVQEVLIDCEALEAIENRISQQLDLSLSSISDLPQQVVIALTDLAIMATKRAS